jgi:hypothetical protein
MEVNALGDSHFSIEIFVFINFDRYSYLFISDANKINEVTLLSYAAEGDEENDEDFLMNNSAIALKETNSESKTAAETKIESVSNIASHWEEGIMCAWGSNIPLSGSDDVSFGIRTESGSLICVVAAPRTCIYAGDMIRIWLIFENVTQPCYEVVAKLIQQEHRLYDGAIMKVIFCSTYGMY